MLIQFLQNKDLSIGSKITFIKSILYNIIALKDMTTRSLHERLWS